MNKRQIKKALQVIAVRSFGSRRWYSLRYFRWPVRVRIRYKSSGGFEPEIVFNVGGIPRPCVQFEVSESSATARRILRAAALKAYAPAAARGRSTQTPQPKWKWQ